MQSAIMSRNWMLIALVFACLFSSSDARAQGPTIDGEQLLVSLPLPDWQVGFTDKKPGASITEYVPKGQSVQNWTRMMTVQIFPGSPLGISDFISAIKAQGEAAKVCERFEVMPAGNKKTPHFEGALAFMICTKNKQHGMGEVTLIQALRGKDGLYVVQRAWRGRSYTPATNVPAREIDIPVEQAEINEWLAFMNKVTLCDSRDPQRACPGAK